MNWLASPPWARKMERRILMAVDQAVSALTTALSQISGQVDKVADEQQALIDKLNSIPGTGMSEEDKTALGEAVEMAKGIANRLQAIDDKIPDNVPATPVPASDTPPAQ